MNRRKFIPAILGLLSVPVVKSKSPETKQTKFEALIRGYFKPTGDGDYKFERVEEPCVGICKIDFAQGYHVDHSDHTIRYAARHSFKFKKS